MLKNFSNLPNHTSHDLLNSKLFFWCCKPLGLSVLHQLVALKSTHFPQLQVAGIGLSSNDECASEIQKAALKHWPECQFFYDRFELSESYDLGLCIGFPFKISLSTIAQFDNGIVNVHFAPLPKYRGSGTLEHAIINGEDRYGVTLHYIDGELDTGEIIDRVWCSLPIDATYLQMVPHLEMLATGLVKKWLPTLVTKLVIGEPQKKLIKEEKIAPLFCTRKSVKKLYALNRSRSFSTLFRYVRALDKGPGKRPYFEHNGKRIYLTVTPY